MFESFIQILLKKKNTRGDRVKYFHVPQECWASNESYKISKWMPESLFYENVIWIKNWSKYQTKIGKKSFEFFWPKRERKPR